MAVAHKSVISFGLVAIPISMYTATQDKARTKPWLYCKIYDENRNWFYAASCI
ncbi:MAG: hypothetical protein ACOX2N_05945 [Peptococcia bacterium]|jgi:hypothetical protein